MVDKLVEQLCVFVVCFVAIVLLCLFSNISQSTESVNTAEAAVSIYTTSEDSRFVTVERTRIADGTYPATYLVVLVDKQTKVMYMQTSKRKTGISLQMMTDADGKPLIYTEPLE